MKRNGKLYLAMTIVQIVIGVIGVVAYIAILMRGGSSSKMLAVLIISLMLVALGVADLRNIRRTGLLKAAKTGELEEHECENIDTQQEAEYDDETGDKPEK